jgi:excisionase family DNA binding protein
MNATDSLPVALVEWVTSIPQTELCAAIGQLEAAKAMALQRLLVPMTAAAPVQPNSSERMTAVELAGIYHVPKSWFYEMARTGRLQCERLGRYVRFSRADVERLIAEDAKSTGLGSRKKRRTNGTLRGAATASLPARQVTQ